MHSDIASSIPLIPYKTQRLATLKRANRQDLWIKIEPFYLVLSSKGIKGWLTYNKKNLQKEKGTSNYGSLSLDPGRSTSVFGCVFVLKLPTVHAVLSYCHREKNQPLGWALHRKNQEWNKISFTHTFAVHWKIYPQNNLFASHLRIGFPTRPIFWPCHYGFGAISKMQEKLDIYLTPVSGTI